LYVPAGRETVQVSEVPGAICAPALLPRIAKLCTSLPLLLMMKVIFPEGIDDCDSWNAYSTMFTVTVVLPVPTGTVLVVVVGGGAVVVVVGGGGGGVTALTPTEKVPFMPAAAWPGIVHE
jgi:hypothetical protein